MAELRPIFKFMLFFSGYSPLFLIMTLIKMQDILILFNKTPDTPINFIGIFILFLDFLSVIAILFTIKILNIPQQLTNPYMFYPISVKNENSYHLEYLVTYILPLLAINIDSKDPENSIYQMAVLIVVMIITFFIYSRSHLMHSNIFFLILGYNLFRAKNSKDEEIYIISKRADLFINKIIILYPVNNLSNDFFLDLGEIDGSK